MARKTLRPMRPKPLMPKFAIKEIQFVVELRSAEGGAGLTIRSRRKLRQVNEQNCPDHGRNSAHAIPHPFSFARARDRVRAGQTATDDDGARSRPDPNR